MRLAPVGLPSLRTYPLSAAVRVAICFPQAGSQCENSNSYKDAKIGKIAPIPYLGNFPWFQIGMTFPSRIAELRITVDSAVSGQFPTRHWLSNSKSDNLSPLFASTSPYCRHGTSNRWYPTCHHHSQHALGAHPHLPLFSWALRRQKVSR